MCHITAALEKLSLKKIVHLVVTPDPLILYTKLKETLLASHELTDLQQVELLLVVETLGGRKTSELLADMWEFCPSNQHNSIFFAGLFLQRLTREIRVMLTHKDHFDLRRLAGHADCLVAFSSRQDIITAAVEIQHKEVVAAIQHKGKQQNKNRRRNQQKTKPLPPHPQGRQSGQQTKTNSTPSTVDWEATGLRFYHWSFGEKAHSCQAP